jgi:hypothetical protein
VSRPPRPIDRPPDLRLAARKRAGSTKDNRATQAPPTNRSGSASLGGRCGARRIGLSGRARACWTCAGRARAECGWLLVARSIRPPAAEHEPLDLQAPALALRAGSRPLPLARRDGEVPRGLYRAKQARRAPEHAGRPHRAQGRRLGAENVGWRDAGEPRDRRDGLRAHASHSRMDGARALQGPAPARGRVSQRRTLPRRRGSSRGSGLLGHGDRL